MKYEYTISNRKQSVIHVLSGTYIHTFIIILFFFFFPSNAPASLHDTQNLDFTV